VTINPSIIVSISVSASPSTTVCPGTNVTFTASPTNAGSNPVYQWQLNSNNVGSNSLTYSSSSLNNNDVISCILTSSAPCSTGNPAASNLITMNVSTSLVADINIIASPSSSVCEGNIITFNANPSNQGPSPVYQWQVNGSGVGTNSISYSSSNFTNGDVVSCILTSSETCVSGSPATSNSINVTVYPTPSTPAIIQSNDSLISNSSNGNQWYLNGAIINGANTYSYIPISSGDYYVIITDNNGCISDTSNIITIIITGIPEINNSDFVLYPNPNNGQFIIKHLGSQKKYYVQIINELGEPLLQEQINNPLGSFDISYLAKGVYFIKIISEKETYLEKLIINR